MEEAKCLLSFSTLTEPSGRCKLLLSRRGIVARGCSTSNGEAEAKTGMIAKIVAGEKCILAKRAEELVTVEPLMCNEEERVRC